MLITMIVQLFTVRIVLANLGEDDYGIYTVVGGVVTMFSFLTSTMANASQRFFAYEIGKNDMGQLKKTFSITLFIYCIIALVILILAETIGLWFLNNKLVIPNERIEAANWVYQFSILTFMLTLFQVPYDALVIAKEKMNVFAFVSIIEVVLKLLIVYLLAVLPFDKLKLYSVLIFVVTLIVTSIYKTYCLKTVKESHYKWHWDKSRVMEIVSYSGWNLFGALAGVGNSQGINIVLNMFFSPAINASRAIAFQLNTTINSFVQNFMTATRPQIIKYYSQGLHDEMLNLVFKSSKFSFLLLFILSLPIVLETEFIINLWLHKTPIYITFFIRMIVFSTLVDTIAYPLVTTAQATGKIKIYQIVVGGCLLLNVPISYVFLRFGYSPHIVFIIAFLNSIVCLFLRLVMLNKMVNLNLYSFFYKVICPILLVSLPVYLSSFWIVNNYNDKIYYKIGICLYSILLTLLLSLTIGTSRSERALIKLAVLNITNKFLKKS